MLWASKAKKGVWRAEWICYLCRRERIVEEYEGIREPHREAARKKFAQKGDGVFISMSYVPPKDASFFTCTLNFFHLAPYHVVSLGQEVYERCA